LLLLIGLQGGKGEDRVYSTALGCNRYVHYHKGDSAPLRNTGMNKSVAKVYQYALFYEFDKTVQPGNRIVNRQRKWATSGIKDNGYLGLAPAPPKK